MFELVKNSVKTHSQILSRKAILSMIHAVERIVNKDALNLTGMTPHTIIYEDDLLSVLHYHPLKDKEIRIGEELVPVSEKTHKIPLVYIPPLLAPGFAFDLFPERSLARYFLAKGFDVYLVDFGSPTKSHSHLSFEDYILEWMPASIEAIRKQSGSRELSLYGYCMGGLFCLLYTTIFQDSDIRNIVTVASPIDTHQMGVAGKALSLVALPAHKLARRLNISLRDIKPEYLHVPGLLGTIGFHLINPLGVLKSYWDLLLNLWDRNYVTAHESLGHWINNLLDYPGATVQEIIVQMALANKLARKGEMTIGHRRAKLKGINCSLLSFAGENDEIVQFESARKIMDVVSSRDKSFHVVPGGHVGLIIGEKAPANLWQISAEWLARRSG